MASIQTVLRNKPNARFLYPIAIRITKDRKTSYIFTGQYIDKMQWNQQKGLVRNSHPDATSINQLILSKLSEANKRLLKAESEKEYQSVSTIKTNIVKKDRFDFFSAVKIQLLRLEERGQFHQRDVVKSRMDKFKAFAKSDKLHFNEITVDLLKRFEAYLKNEIGLAHRTTVNYMIAIRTIYNIAIGEKWAERNHYPFGRGGYTIKFLESDKIGLNVEEVKLLENAQGLTPSQQHALNIWLISFYFAGIRVGDVLQLKWSDFIDNRLRYRMGKNQKLVSLKIPEKAKPILGYYRSLAEDDFVFQELRFVDPKDAKILRTRIKTVTRTCNRHLKKIAEHLGISKKLSMHIARHSFGNISGSKIPIQMLQKLYRHSSVTTTIMYQSNFMQDDVDNALDNVVSF
ncbi:site-specific integrase [Leeuwenhoekiella blandensis]|uniref:site-specific integrase n=1 Tax=Leeuwenhoekiella blandensis TaxID=360293 RepID=UPI002354EAB0|nr:site-specific integrase [Leeuwenhoekiella blandensis]|tara:strand:+ start:2275 stop:3477 length:1203 start_codon:yes stop_codon:yes gene_type:complete